MQGGGGGLTLLFKPARGKGTFQSPPPSVSHLLFSATSALKHPSPHPDTMAQQRSEVSTSSLPEATAAEHDSAKRAFQGVHAHLQRIAFEKGKPLPIPERKVWLAGASNANGVLRCETLPHHARTKAPVLTAQSLPAPQKSSFAQKCWASLLSRRMNWTCPVVVVRDIPTRD